MSTQAQTAPEAGAPRPPGTPGAAGALGAPARVASPVAAWVLVVGGLLGAAMSIILLIEGIHMKVDPTYVPACTINTVFACGSVITTPQGSIVGSIPNPVFGIASFAMLVAAGATLLAGARLPRWWWMCLLAGTLVGVATVLWLAWQSFFVIGALCPWCMGVWFVTMSVLAAVLTLMSREGLVSPWFRAWAVPGLLIWTVLIAVLVVAVFHRTWFG